LYGRDETRLHGQPSSVVLFLIELIEMLKARNCTGVFVNEDADTVISVFYADETAGEAGPVLYCLQQQIYCVSDFCYQYGMMIIPKKHKTHCFHKRKNHKKL
jgi:hypothetical protein